MTDESCNFFENQEIGTIVSLLRINNQILVKSVVLYIKNSGRTKMFIISTHISYEASGDGC